MIRNEHLGTLRYVEMMLAQCRKKIEEEWNEGEVMLSPSESDEEVSLMRKIRYHIGDIQPWVKKFAESANARRVDTAGV